MKTRICIVATAIMAFSANGQLVNGTLVNGTLVNARPRPLTTFVDTFDRTDADPMTTGASDGVGVWTDGDGTFSACRIGGNILYGTSGLEFGCRVLTPVFLENQSASIILGTLPLVGIRLRVQSPTDGSCYVAVVNDLTHIIIYKLVDDIGSFTYTPIGAAFTVETINILDTLTFSISGSVMEVFVNGVSLGTRTDSTFTTGQPGTFLYGFDGSIVNFTATEL